MSVPTPRGADVVRRAQQLGLTAEYNSDGETVTITGATRTIFTTVSQEADAYLRGYFDGAARAHRSESEQRRLERVIDVARDHDPQLIDGIMEANR